MKIKSDEREVKRREVLKGEAMKGLTMVQWITLIFIATTNLWYIAH